MSTVVPTSQDRLAALEQRIVENNHRIADSIIDRERTSARLATRGELQNAVNELRGYVTETWRDVSDRLDLLAEGQRNRQVYVSNAIIGALVSIVICLAGAIVAVALR
jgi:hypothetical protein